MKAHQEYIVTLMFCDQNMPRLRQEVGTEEAGKATVFHLLNTMASVKGIWLDCPNGDRHVFNRAGYLFTIDRSTSIL